MDFIKGAPDWIWHRYLDAVDLVDDHPHATVWVIGGLLILLIWAAIV